MQKIRENLANFLETLENWTTHCVLLTCQTQALDQFRSIIIYDVSTFMAIS